MQKCRGQGMESIKDIIQEIESKASKYPAIYRGESECHRLISSSLYREYEKYLNLIITTENFDLETLTKIILAEYRDQIIGHSNKIDFDLRLKILSEIQHYEGKTTFIDFSYSYFVAMFFASTHNLDKDGRVIILNKNKVNDIIYEPEKTNNRVVVQKSVFVIPETGVILDNHVDIVKIPAKLKMPILNHLRKYHNINKGTIYNDTIGFVQQQDTLIKAWHYYLQGNAYIKGNGDIATNLHKALEMYNKALEINPHFDVAYTQRAEIFLQLEQLENAMADFKASMNISPQFSHSYFGISKVYYRQDDFEMALDYSKQALEIQSKSLKDETQKSLYKDMEEHHKKICHKMKKS